MNTTRSGRVINKPHHLEDQSANMSTQSTEKIPYGETSQETTQETSQVSRRPGPQRNLASNRFEVNHSRLPTVRLSNKKRNRLKKRKKVYADGEHDKTRPQLTEEEVRKKRRRQRSERVGCLVDRRN
ncbi:uncharacterized protein LOC118761098 [Octopus sinensis]|uniref:Uncharacterized protein LOC118761098 n=1 Tax=Octopus sinensis TaxID=2607531 RepID=A0A7E6EGG9_9MOLL|nr:uncharacterized protein LOC118761098 [Octopus sinensis]